MKRIAYILPLFLMTACQEVAEYDAQGTFEATEVTLSAESNGKILHFDVNEGDIVQSGVVIGAIDSIQLFQQRKQLIAQQAALLNSRPDKEKQVAAIKQQIATANRELQRVESLLGDGAATSKQRDDIKAQINLLQDQLSATLSTLDKNTSSINNKATALEAQIAALDDMLSKCSIISPIDGTVLVKYAQAGELATMGKPLMKVADLSQIYLRAYFTSDQLAHLNLGNEVTVTADFGADQRYDYKGKVVWISSESEFTPKTIQTKDTRANLVYAVKIAVKNDGRLKVGLAGEVKL